MLSRIVADSHRVENFAKRLLRIPGRKGTYQPHIGPNLHTFQMSMLGCFFLLSVGSPAQLSSLNPWPGNSIFPRCKFAFGISLTSVSDFPFAQFHPFNLVPPDMHDGVSFVGFSTLCHPMYFCLQPTSRLRFFFLRRRLVLSFMI